MKDSERTSMNMMKLVKSFLQNLCGTLVIYGKGFGFIIVRV